MDDSSSQQSCSWTQHSCAPLKMLAVRLKQCKERPGTSSSFWMELSGGGEVEVSLVWMQGRVIEVRPERGGSLLLSDDTHTFTVVGADKAPKGKPCLERGKYVMVMGTVLSCNPEPVLRVVKITDLSENPVHQDMWNLEVDDLHKNIKYT